MHNELFGQRDQLDALQELKKLTATYDSVDLLSAIAGLQLLPDNAGRNIRLEALAHVVSSNPPTRRRRAAPHILRRLCNKSPILSIVHAEDPFDNVFVEEVTFHGGSYLVLPGIVEEATFILSHLSKAIFLHQDAFPSQQFVLDAQALIRAVLLLSDDICRRAGLRRNPEPVGHPSREVVIPTVANLGRLKRAAPDSVSGLLRQKRIPDRALDRLIIGSDQIALTDYSFVDGPLTSRPIVRFRNELVVAIPGMLIGALRNAIISLAGEIGVAAELASRYKSAVWHSVAEFLRYTHCEPYSIQTPQNNQIACSQDGFFSLDTDKVLYVLLLTDPLNQLRDPHADWPTTDLGAEVENRLSAINNFVLSAPDVPNEVLCLVLFQGVGRGGGIAFGNLMKYILVMTAADLWTSSLLEGGKDLALWKFAYAADEVRQHARIVCTGVLDEYSAFRHYDYSYYASDEIRPNIIVIPPGGAGELRREAFRQRDWHAVTSFNPGYVIEVTRLHEDAQVPIYAPATGLGGRVAFFVEGLPVPLWVIEPNGGDKHQQGLHTEYARFADAIAYWLWQFGPSLIQVLKIASRRHPCVVIVLHLIPDKRWHEHVEGEQQIQEQAIYVESGPETGTIHVTLRASITALLQTADNTGEREFVRQILVGIRNLLPSKDGRSLRDEVIPTLLNRHAPLGVKKKVFYLDMSMFPELDPRALPRPRMVQHADRNAILDRIGEYFLTVKRVPIGTIGREEAAETFNEVVTYCYRQLEQLVATLAPRNLLDWLVAYHEAITRASSQSQLTIATRIACFSDDHEMVKHIREEHSDYAEALLASRFLIEYVTACPPRGLRPISLSAYDLLAAFASLIINYGMVSDVIHFEIAQIGVSMLPSGRLGFSGDEYKSAMDQFRSVFASGKVARSSAAFRRHWREPTNGYNASLREQIDNATRAEFGHSLGELVEMMTRAMEIGLETPPLTVMEIGELSRQLQQRLNWPPEKLASALSLLSLEPRDQFLVPPATFSKEDVYPWRFTRRLSYLRRPFLHRVSERRREIIWGNRHLSDAQNYLTQLCVGGRLQGRTPEMKKLVSRYANTQSLKFNDEVADFLETIPGLIVRRRVRKIGALRGSAAPPGDIDVLVADAQKRTLSIYECKDLSLARNPYEMASEISGILGTPGKKSIVERHLDRVKWSERNLQSVLTWLGLEFQQQWRVLSAIIVDQPVWTPHVRELPVPVISFDALKHQFRLTALGVRT